MKWNNTLTWTNKEYGGNAYKATYHIYNGEITVDEVDLQFPDWKLMSVDTLVLSGSGSLKHFAEIVEDGYPRYYSNGWSSLTTEDKNIKLSKKQPWKLWFDCGDCPVDPRCEVEYTVFATSEVLYGIAGENYGLLNQTNGTKS